MREQRLRTNRGLHVELGVAPITWATSRPVDAGSARVTRDGLIPLYDPDHALEALLADLGQT